MSQHLDSQPGLIRTHRVCHTFCTVPVVVGVLGIACFATGALVPVGVVLILTATVLGVIGWAVSSIDQRYERTHHYDITNEDQP